MSNNSLHNYIEQDEELKHKSNQLREEYDRSVQALSQQRQKAMDEAKITNARLQKYIPQILKSQGVGGNVGLTEDSIIKLNHDYNSRLGEIDGNYSSAKAVYDNNYSSALSSLYSEAAAKRSGSQLENYNIMLENMANWQGTADELRNYLNENKDKVSGTQFENLSLQLNNNVDSINQAYDAKKKMYIGESRAADGLSTLNNGENFSLSLGNNKYKLEVKDEYSGSDSGEILQKAINANVNDGDVFYYNGNIYLKYGDKMYNVGDRSSSNKNKNSVIDYLRIDQYEG